MVDDTVIDDVLLGRRVPVEDEHDGLWHANQLCDLVQMRSSSAGTTESGSMPGNERPHTRPLGLGPAVGVRLAQAAHRAGPASSRPPNPWPG